MIERNYTQLEQQKIIKVNIKYFQIHMKKNLNKSFKIDYKMKIIIKKNKN